MTLNLPALVTLAAGLLRIPGLDKPRAREAVVLHLEVQASELAASLTPRLQAAIDEAMGEVDEQLLERYGIDIPARVAEAVADEVQRLIDGVADEAIEAASEVVEQSPAAPQRPLANIFRGALRPRRLRRAFQVQPPPTGAASG